LGIGFSAIIDPPTPPHTHLEAVAAPKLGEYLIKVDPPAAAASFVTPF